MHVGVTLPTLGSHGHLFPAGYPFECVGPIWGTACFAQASQTTAKTCTPEVTTGGCACMRDVARIAKHDTLVVTREGVQWHITSTLFALALKRGCLERSQWHELQFGCYALLRHWCHPCTNVFTWAQSRNRIQHLLYNAAVPLTVSCDGRQVGKQHAPSSKHSPEAGPPATCKPLGLGCFLFASAVAPVVATFAGHGRHSAGSCIPQAPALAPFQESLFFELFGQFLAMCPLAPQIQHSPLMSLFLLLLPWRPLPLPYALTAAAFLDKGVCVNVCLTFLCWRLLP